MFNRKLRALQVIQQFGKSGNERVFWTALELGLVGRELNQLCPDQEHGYILEQVLELEEPEPDEEEREGPRW